MTGSLRSVLEKGSGPGALALASPPPPTPTTADAQSPVATSGMNVFARALVDRAGLTRARVHAAIEHAETKNLTLLEVVLAKMDAGIDDLIGMQKAIQRFGAMSTLLNMHMLLDAVRESAPVPVQNMDPLALKWIEDNARSYAEELMNHDVIAATAKVVGSPELKLHFGRAFRRRILGYN